jgi:hypothetical protein
MAVRTAVRATRVRMGRQLFVEALVVAWFAAAVALPMASASRALFASIVGVGHRSGHAYRRMSWNRIDAAFS